MVTIEDLVIINDALSKGYDVEIQNAKDGYRIISKAAKVLKRSSHRKTLKYGFSDERK